MLKRAFESPALLGPILVVLALATMTWGNVHGASFEMGGRWLVREHVEASTTRVGLAMAAVARDAGDLASVERLRGRHHLTSLSPGTQLRVVSPPTFSNFVEVRIESGPSTGRIVFVDGTQPSLQAIDAGARSQVASPFHHDHEGSPPEGTTRAIDPP